MKYVKMLIIIFYYIPVATWVLLGPTAVNMIVQKSIIVPEMECASNLTFARAMRVLKGTCALISRVKDVAVAQVSEI